MAHCDINVVALVGFQMAVHSQICSRARNFSAWFGSPRSNPQTEVRAGISINGEERYSTVPFFTLTDGYTAVFERASERVRERECHVSKIKKPCVFPHDIMLHYHDGGAVTTALPIAVGPNHRSRPHWPVCRGGGGALGNTRMYPGLGDDHGSRKRHCLVRLSHE